MRDVFISYSSEDREAAEQICQALESRGLSCWIAPRDIQGGQSWAAAIVRAIEECRVMLVVVSTSANISRQMPREVELADSKHRAVLPVRIQNVALVKDLEFFLGNRQWIDAFPGPIGVHGDRLAGAVASLKYPTEVPPAVSLHANAAQIPSRPTFQPATPVFPPPAAPIHAHQPLTPAAHKPRRVLPWVLAAGVLLGLSLVGLYVQSQEQEKQRQALEMQARLDAEKRAAEERVAEERLAAQQKALQQQQLVEEARQQESARQQAQQVAATQQRLQILQLAGIPPALLNQAQQIRFVAALQNYRCMCGCPYGSYLSCLRNEPTCRRRSANIQTALQAARSQ
jgi:TIR domain